MTTFTLGYERHYRKALMSTEIESPQKKGNGPSRRTLLRTAAWSTPVIAMSVGAPPAMAASPTCLPVGTLFTSIARGQLLSGQILGTSLDAVAELHSTEASTPGATTEDTQSNPLGATVLNTINAELGGVGGALSGILQFAAPAETGAVGQYAYAHENGNVRGASGVVGNDGAVTLNPAAAAALGPVATIDLYRVLQQGALSGLPVVADLLAEITDLELQVGAVYGRSQFNSRCVPPAVAGSPELQPGDYAFLRDYLLAYLRLYVSSDSVVGALAGNLASAVAGIDLVGAVTGAVSGLLSGLGLLSVTGGLTLDATQLTGKIPPTDGHALQLNLDQGQVILDLGAILGGTTTGLNGLSPNTLLFADQSIPTDAVGTEGGTLLAALLDVLRDLIKVNLKITLAPALLPITVVEITNATLGDLIDGTAQITILGGLVPAELATDLVAAIVGVLTDILFGLLTPGQALYTTVFGNLNALLANVFGVLKNVIRLTVNAQNDATGTVPPPFTSIEQGRYDVAALHVGVVTGSLLDVFLARGSGGKNVQK